MTEIANIGVNIGEVIGRNITGSVITPEMAEQIPGFYRRPGVPSPTIMVIEGWRATPNTVKIWRANGLLPEYKDKLAFFTKVDQLRVTTQPVTEISEIRIAVAAG